MAQTYTRQSSFIDGDTITAALFNDEYNQLVNAFAYSSTSAANTGHRHDGTAGQGGNIPQIGDLDFLNKIVVDSTNNRWGFYVEVSSAAVEQIRIQDGAIVPVTDNDIDLGTSSLEFKDAFFDGTLTTDALVADTADINGGTVDGATIGANSASTGAFTSVTTTGNVDVGGNLTVTGTTTFNGGTLTLGDAADDNVVFGADVNSNIIPNTDNTYDLGSSSQEWKDLYVDGIAYLDGINFNGTAITSTAAELNILDGVTSTTAELNILDGVTSTTAELNILDGVTSTAAELNILDGVTATATEINILDGVTSSTAELNILDGVTATATEINLLDGVTSTTAELNILDGVTSTATELNLLDGVTATTTELNYVDVATAGTVEASKAIVVDSNKDFTGARNITITGELDAATLDVSGDVDIDGTLEADAITVNGTTLAETISDTVGAMVTSNTETGVTVTYDDSDNTLDFVIGTLNQDTTGTAALATQVTISANNSTDETIFPVFVDGATGSQGLETDTGFTYNPSTGLLTATGFSGNLTGTLQTAAQTNVTSLGTLSALTISGNLIVDTSTLKVDSSSNRVGIGTASPSSLLTVEGDIRQTSGDLLYAGGGNWDIKHLADDQSIVFYTSESGSATEKMRIKANGAIGIGTSSPSASHKLTVGGDTKFTGQLSILDNQLIKMGDGEDFALYHDTTVGNVIKSATSDMDISILGNDGGSTITALKFDMSAAGRAVFNAGANFSDHVNFDDNAKAVFGGGDDLQIYHNGTNSYIADAGTGDLRILATDFRLLNAAEDANLIRAFNGAEVELYHNGTERLATTSSGATVTGTLVSDGLTVDTSTLVVDATNNRVGIGNASPDVSLDIGSLTDAIHVPVGTTAQRPTGAAGYFRYNSETGKFEGFTNEWGAIAGGGSGTNMDTNIFAGDGSDTTFTLSTAPDSENNLMVFIDGVFQAQNVYSVSGTTLTFATAPANGRVITVYHSTTTVGGSNNSIATMTGDGSDTTLTLSTAPVHENNVSVFFDGVYQSKSNYSISGTTLTFSTAPPSGVAVEAITATNTSITTATQLSDADGDTLIQTEESSDEDKIRFDTGGTERMIIDDSGNVGIGETSPLATLHIKQGDSGLSSLNAAAHHLFLEDTGANGPGITLASGTTSNCSLVFGDSDSNYQGFILYDNSADAMKFGTNGGSERMRILSGGNVLLNQTATADSGVADGRLEITRGSQHCINCHVTGTGNSTLVAFINDNGFVGGINTNGSATAFNTSSDARLKNVLGEAKGLEIVNALNPVNFEWKSDGKIQDGLIAQEVEKVFPEAVSEPELEGEWYSVDYSKLVTPLIKAMQEQQELIETQQTTINDLKTRIETLES